MNVYGKEAYQEIANLFPQIYLVPGRDTEEDYKQVVLQGKIPVDRSLSQYIMSDADHFWMEETPAGPVYAMYADERPDFETLIRDITHKARMDEIPATIGAANVNGVISQTLYKAKVDPFKVSMILLSSGPYSNISAETAGYRHEEWKRISVEIRRFHECTHFICRNRFPEYISPIFDELVADAIGLYGALERYDIHLAGLFLGVDEDGYHEGRLINYYKKEYGDLQKLAKQCWKTMQELERIIEGDSSLKPYEVLEIIESKLQGKLLEM